MGWCDLASADQQAPFEIDFSYTKLVDRFFFRNDLGPATGFDQLFRQQSALDFVRRGFDRLGGGTGGACHGAGHHGQGGHDVHTDLLALRVPSFVAITM